MLFQWTDVNGNVKHDWHAEVGSKVYGIRHNLGRPTEVVLTRTELLQLLEHPSYAATICATMSLEPNTGK